VFTPQQLQAARELQQALRRQVVLKVKVEARK
jgi:hypothetical protein